MLLAYIDEIGETGAFVSANDAKYRTSPAYGYGGFIIPEQHARHFAAKFAEQKKQLFAREIAQTEHPGRFERKGSDLLRPDTPDKHPEHLRVFDALVREVRDFGGNLFYYANEKQTGTPKQVPTTPTQRDEAAIREALNRIARHSNHLDQNVLIMLDQVNEKTRAARLPNMYAHILGRAPDFPEMRRVVEPPMHIDSQLSSNIQFADWVAACIFRALDYQLNPASRYAWVADPKRLKYVRGSFTGESKLHLWKRAIEDLHHSTVFNHDRAVIDPPVTGQRLGDCLDPAVGDKIRSMAGAPQQKRSAEEDRGHPQM